jgi:hypothetical protein
MSAIMFESMIQRPGPVRRRGLMPPQCSDEHGPLGHLDHAQQMDRFPPMVEFGKRFAAGALRSSDDEPQESVDLWLAC